MNELESMMNKKTNMNLLNFDKIDQFTNILFYFIQLRYLLLLVQLNASIPGK